MSASVIEQLKAQLAEDSGLLWWPGLSEKLVTQVLACEQIDLSSYTTTQLLTLGTVQPTLLQQIEPNGMSLSPKLRIECLPDSLNNYFAKKGILLYQSEIMANNHLLQVLRGGAELIGQAPSLARTVECLAKSVHIIYQDDPNCDVSFSDPKIPYSIFVSASTASSDSSLRVAEAIIHESMHLQLSLVEQCMALVSEPNAKYYSPWKKELRHVSGVLHALYVFAVIKQWMAQLPTTSENRAYITRRQTQLRAEIELVDASSCINSLTHDGRRLLSLTLRVLKQI